MNKHLLFLSLALSLTLAQPAPAFFSGFGSGSKSATTAEKTSAWDKLVSSANETMKKSEQDEGNKDNPTWDQLTKRADQAMKQFAKDGKGFDIMRKIERKIEKIAADENSTLTGRFYDLKQPLDPKKSKPLHRHQVVQFIKNFMDADWDREMLEQYYSPDVKLEAPYFYLPRCKASYAPEAFMCNTGNQKRQVQPLDWLVVYSGVVIAPESGKFRFVGMGDDAIVVRFDNKVVLEAGWSIPSRSNMTLGTSRTYQEELISPKEGKALYQYKETPHWNSSLGGIPSGTPFQVKEGKAYPIEIILSEIPGNEFGFCLLIEKLANGNAPRGKFAPGDSPTLALFRTNETTPDLKEIEESLRKDGKNYIVRLPLEAPPFLEESPMWRAISKGKAKRNMLERVAATATSDEDTAMGRRVEDDETAEEGTEKEEAAPEENDAEAKAPVKQNNKGGKKK